MVFDFGVVKKKVKDILDDCLDHKLAVPTQSGALEALTTSPNVALAWRYNGGLISMAAPACSIAAMTTTASVIASGTIWLEAQGLPLMPSNSNALKLY